MAAHDTVTLNETASRLEVPQSGDTYNFPRSASITGDATISGKINLGGNTATATGGIKVTTLEFADGSSTTTASAVAGAGTQQDVVDAGSTANLPTDFVLSNTAGTQELLDVHATKGLQGVSGNVSNPLTDLQLNQIETEVFHSDAFTVTSAAAAVTGYPSLRTIGLTMTAGAKAGVAAGQYAEIAGILYPITGVASAVLTLEYDYDVADPTASDLFVCKWRFAGKYAGQITYARAERHNYFDINSGLMRTAPAGFPALQAGSDGQIGFVRSVGLKNEHSVTNWRATGMTLSGSGTSTEAYTATGVDGAATSALTVDDTDAATTATRRMPDITVVDDTATHTGIFLVSKANSAIQRVDLKFLGGSAGIVSAYIDPSDGSLSSASDSSATVRDFGTFWLVTLSITNDASGNTSLRQLVAPRARATLEGANDVTLLGTADFDYLGVFLNTTVAGNPVYPQVTSVSDTFEFPAKGNDVGETDDISIVIDYELFGVSAADVDRLLDGDDANFWIGVAVSGSSARRCKLHKGAASANAGGAAFNTHERMTSIRKGALQEVSADGAITTTASPADSGTANTVLAVGHLDGAPTSFGLTGIIHRVRIYSYALTGTEVGAA